MESLLKYYFDGSNLSDEDFKRTYSLIEDWSWNGCFDIPPFPTRKFYAFFERPIESGYLSLPKELIVTLHSGSIS